MFLEMLNEHSFEQKEYKRNLMPGESWTSEIKVETRDWFWLRTSHWSLCRATLQQEQGNFTFHRQRLWLFSHGSTHHTQHTTCLVYEVYIYSMRVHMFKLEYSFVLMWKYKYEILLINSYWTLIWPRQAAITGVVHCRGHHSDWVGY